MFGDVGEGNTRVTKREWMLLSAVLGLAFVLGCIFVQDFGQGTDEFSNFEYAANTLRSYLGNPVTVGPSFDELHGPFHLAFALVFGEVATTVHPSWTATDGRHLANFFVFVIGIGALYVLCRRYASWRASALAAALFGTQPVLLGHGFINQKDTAFMVYFLLSFVVGLCTIDRLSWRPPWRLGATSGGDVEAGDGIEPRSNDDRAGSRPLKAILRWSAFVLLLLSALMTLMGILFLPILNGLLSQAYSGNAIAPLQRVFDLVATDAYKTPLSLYMDKLDLIYAWVKIPLTIGWLGAAGFFLRRSMPGVWHKVYRRLPQGWAGLIVAGVLLGLANSIRVAAPLAGVLVGAYLVSRLHRRAWLPLILYGGSALVASYLTWPWLWQDPIGGYLESIRVMSSFPPHKVLFGGEVILSSQIPWDYVPRLLALKTTEVVLPLFLIGLGAGLWHAFRSRVSRLELSLGLLWLGVPIVLAIVLHSSLYGNLRQVLFILPPVFVVGAWAIEFSMARLARPIWRAVLVMIVLVPGLIGIFRLHPYEDSYYNIWIGSTSGAFGRYQVDPWCTSYREAVEYLNLHAPQGAVVDVRGPFQSALDFARPDLVMRPDYNPAPHPDYALMCQIDVLGDGFQGTLPIVYRVTRGRAVLAVVRGSP